MFSWFGQSNYGAVTGGGSSPTDSPTTKGGIVVPPMSTRVMDTLPISPGVMAAYLAKMEAGTRVASFDLRLLPSSGKVSHTVSSMLGDSRCYVVHVSESTGQAIVSLENTTDTTMSVTFTKTVT